MRTWFREAAAIFFLFAAMTCVWSQEPDSPQGGKTRIEPIFPEVNENLVFVEGEDAVSTNFAREPVLNYSCSGQRTLQLSGGSGQQGAGSYYADYVFSIPAGGTYELWYGGTPPGPKEDLYPSYASPFQVSLDNGKPLPVTREGVSVGEGYSPSYYWTSIGDLTLDGGRHSIRFAVTEKRRSDGRYLFYLDCFFFVRKEAGQRVLTPPLPAVFPKSFDTKTTNTPFLSVDDHLIRIRDNPSLVQPLVELSLLYTMLGDYLNALKYLNRAALLDPGNTRVLLLIAKNRIWKGDTAEGLKRYRDLLSGDPSQRDVWMEAGKVAAWSGRYDDSVAFYRDGLGSFPKDPDMMVNLGLTYLWAGRGTEAEGTARELRAIAGSDSGLLKGLGRIYQVNGYPERALEMYQLASRVVPADLEAYLLAANVQQSLGKEKEAEKTRQLTTDTFFPSPRLTEYLEAFQARLGMKEQVIAEYQQRLRDHPDDLTLRQTLAQTYFWNGRKADAIAGYRLILANHEHIAFKDLERRWSGLLLAIDRAYLAGDYLTRVPESARKTRAEMETGAARFRAALTARDAALKTRDADAGKAAAVAAASEEKLTAAESALSTAAAELSAKTASTRALTVQTVDAIGLLSTGSEEESGFQEKDAAEQGTFADLTRGNHWTWDRPGTVEELKQDSPTSPLARLVLAKIYLSGRQTASALALLSAASAGSDGGLGIRFTRAQSLLWGGKAEEAAQLIASLAMSEEASSLPPYYAELARVIGRLSLESMDPAALADSAADPLADAAAAAGELSAAEKQAAAARAGVARHLDTLHALYARAATRAVYSFEESTAGIRNELGDYYLGEKDLRSAILQFRRVLAIDPNDMSARFRLGKVYQWNNDWRGALDSYEAVYLADPAYENVAGLFNQVSREHSQGLATTASYIADTTHVQWHAEGTAVLPLDSLWGVTGSYQADAVQTDFAAVVPPYPSRSFYQVQDASIGLPIDLYFMGLKVTPQAGGILTGSLLSWTTDPLAGATALSLPGLLRSYTAWPYAKADLALTAGSLFTLSSSLRWGPYAETLDPLRTLAYDTSAEANLTFPLSFVDAYPFRDTTLRTYAKVDYLTDFGFGYRNLIATGVEEVVVHLLKGGSPYSLLTLIGNAAFQHSLGYEGRDYYSPIGELTAGGSLMGSTWIGIGGGSVLGLSLRGYAGAYVQHIFDALPISYAKLEAQADVSIESNGSAYTFTVLANTALGRDSGGQIQASYWSMFARLGYSLKLPRLLTP